VAGSDIRRAHLAETFLKTADLMRFMASRPVRIFVLAWVLYSIHFATNVVREHYPAFSFAEHGTFFVDDYQGFHPDIFRHINGHSVIGNQVLVSMMAAIPLFIFDPVLDAVEAHSKSKLAQAGSAQGSYDTDKPMRVAFFRLVKEKGLDLRFGAATAITSVFFMAPLAALFLAFFYTVLIRRNVSPHDATWLTVLLGFATPLFYRATVLGHNMFVMYGMFIAFVLLWSPQGGSRLRPATRFAAGMFAGLTVATDYMGVLLIPLLYGYFFAVRQQNSSRLETFRESLVFVAGTIPPILFLLYTQWWMYGNPFLPGQYWMPEQNIYTEVGMRGFTLPAPDLMLKNLLDPGYGLYTWGPLLALGLWPVFARKGSLILPRRERRFAAVCFVGILLFSSANQYARLQWNSGFRYLLPLVPFILLALSDHWVRLPQWARYGIAAATLLHSWVLTVFRELTLQRSWELFLQEGVQLPWLRVFRMTSGDRFSIVETQVLSIAILGLVFLSLWIFWRLGARLEKRAGVSQSFATTHSPGGFGVPS
jgi:hypothetical protein